MSIITVGKGPGFDFQTIAEGVAASQSGDTVNVQAGTYTNDFTQISHSLTLQAVGGMVIMDATQNAPNGKAILTEGTTLTAIDVRIDGFAFTNATVADGNGAGIRYEGGSLTVTNSLFKGNQDGILGAADPNGVISISHSEFDGNGVGGDGHTHNMYIGDISSFSLTDSFTHDAIVGHEIKSRAANNIITNNRIFDNNSSASYSIDLPNGGNATITGNVIEQGPNTQNSIIIAYGEEGGLHPGTSLVISNNTFVNDHGSGPALSDVNTSTVAEFTNNSVYGFNGPLVNGSANESGTVVLGTRPALDQSSPIESPPVCYVRGTYIATPGGESKIEDLLRGDVLITVESGDHVERAVKWVGCRHLDLTKHPRPATVAPIRIQRGAFAENTPHRDLLLSPDHAIFVDGKLICARQLVNGTTIAREMDRTSVEYFHVELDRHAVLLAEGLPTESYLDTGNRGFFADSARPRLLHPDLTEEINNSSREAGSCAPFVWDEASVRPVWQRLADRATILGRPVTPPKTSDDPELRLITKGRTFIPTFSSDGRYIFALPMDVTEMHLVSRAAAATDTKPWLEDSRQLGIRLKRIALRGMNETVDVPLDGPALRTGWWAVEREGRAMRRWTTGDAVLLLPTIAGPCVLEIDVSGLSYPVRTAQAA